MAIKKAGKTTGASLALGLSGILLLAVAAVLGWASYAMNNVVLVMFAVVFLIMAIPFFWGRSVLLSDSRADEQKAKTKRPQGKKAGRQARAQKNAASLEEE